MPLYIGDYLADTMHMNCVQHGAYLLLLMHQWRSGPLPNEDAQLSAIARCDLATWRKVVAPVVRPFFDLDHGRLSQKRLAAERDKADLIVSKRAEAGRKGAAAKHQKPNDDTKFVQKNLGYSEAFDVAIAIADASANAQQTDSTLCVQSQSQSQSQEEAAAERNTHPTQAGPSKVHQPRRSDPPHKWASIAETWEIDQKMVRRPVVAGEYFDLLVDQVLTAAGINDPHWAGDLAPIIGWLKSGKSGAEIIASVRQVAARQSYKPANSLKYFDAAVREFVAAK